MRIVARVLVAPSGGRGSPSMLRSLASSRCGWMGWKPHLEVSDSTAQVRYEVRNHSHASYALPCWGCKYD